jgi:nitrite reductase (cytochrome c-552)
MGFHADQEAVRILSNSINFSRLGQNALRPGGGASTSPTTRPEGAPAPAKAPGTPKATGGSQQGSR